MNSETSIIAGAKSLVRWAIEDTERNGSLEHAIHNLKRIYAFLADEEFVTEREGKEGA